MFQNVGKISEIGLSLGCQTGKFLDELPPISQDVVSSMTVCTDQEQSQITGGEFIFAPEPQGPVALAVASLMISTVGATT